MKSGTTLTKPDTTGWELYDRTTGSDATRFIEREYFRKGRSKVVIRTYQYFDGRPTKYDTYVIDYGYVRVYFS